MTNLSEIQLDGAALLHNLESLKTLVPRQAKVAAVVKGNAYGHGMEEVVRVLEGHVDYFQIDDLDELRAFRRISQSPVLVLGYIPKDGIGEALQLGAEIALYDLDRIPLIAESAAHPKVHLKIDALLGRLGILPNDLESIVAALRDHPSIHVMSAYAHFANIEDAPDLGHALAQIETFEACHQRLKESGWPNLGRHLSATSGVMAHETSATTNNLVRLGVGLYGMYPSAPLARTHASLSLAPVMRWVSHLAQVKTLPPHHPVGYGLTYITSRQTTVGIVPQGYSDGYDRGLSNSGEVLVQGQRCPVIGRVAMNMFAIDLTSVANPKPEDEVVLLGTQGSEQITAEEIASRIGTINYEITTRVSPLLPRTV